MRKHVEQQMVNFMGQFYARKKIKGEWVYYVWNQEANRYVPLDGVTEAFMLHLSSALDGTKVFIGEEC